MKYDIVHKGIVREVGDGFVVVGVEAEGACEGCKVQAMCGMNGVSEKEIAVAERGDYAVGDEVAVGVGTAMAAKAVALAYIVPFMLMLAVLLTLKQTGFSELVQGLGALAAAAVWYAVLWFLRGKLTKDIVFKIAKI